MIAPVTTAPPQAEGTDAASVPPLAPTRIRYGGSHHRKYAASKAWQERRRLCFERDGYTCQDCGATPPDVSLHCHHLTYIRLGCEAPDDLRTLCQDCHSVEHGRPAVTGAPDDVLRRFARDAHLADAQRRTLTRATQFRRLHDALDVYRAVLVDFLIHPETRREKRAVRRVLYSLDQVLRILAEG